MSGSEGRLLLGSGRPRVAVSRRAQRRGLNGPWALRTGWTTLGLRRPIFLAAVHEEAPKVADL